MTALDAPPTPATATARVADACVVLGIHRHQFYGAWKHVFTPYYSAAGRRVVCREELAEAAQYPSDPERARAAVLALRQRLGRLPRFRD